jgi:cobalt-precorrin-7 (C5)-methyltransferase
MELIDKQSDLKDGQVYIVGLGPGSREYILPKAVKVLESCDLILGFERAMSSINFVKKNKITVKSLKEITEIIDKNPEKKISIIASGDPCFYGITNYIKRKVTSKINVIPGISSFQYLMAKLSKPWQGAFLGSMHGREEDFINVVKKYDISIWLTDKNNSPDSLSRKLVEENIEANIYVGENLSYEDEIIIVGTAQELQKKQFSDLAVVVVEKGS